MEIKHDNRNNNQRPNNPPKKPQQLNPYTPGRPREQKHILAELKAKYGPDFIRVAHLYGEFSGGPIRFKFTQLLRTIFKGQFNFDEYGIYILDPLILNNLLELAQIKIREAQIHLQGTMVLMWNPQYCCDHYIDFNEVAKQYLVDQDHFNAWNKILQALQNTQMTGNIQHLMNAVPEMSTMPAQSPMVKNLCDVI